MASTDFTPVTVRHINKNHVTISASSAYSVVLFTLKDGNVEAVVTANDGSEAIRLLISGPGPNQELTIKPHKPTGIVDIIYTEKRHDKA